MFQDRSIRDGMLRGFDLYIAIGKAYSKPHRPPIIRDACLVQQFGPDEEQI